MKIGKRNRKEVAKGRFTPLGSSELSKLYGGTSYLNLPPQLPEPPIRRRRSPIDNLLY